jgi:hypothetical protein
MSTKWRPAAARWEQAFERVMEEMPNAERKERYGYLALFRRGSLTAGLHSAGLYVRLSEADRKQLIDLGGMVFEPLPGKKMHEYVIVPADFATDLKSLRAWIDRAMAFTETSREGRHAERGKARGEKKRDKS